MLTLINTNRMMPAIAPIGLDYLTGGARRAGIGVQVVDLCLVDDPDAALAEHFRGCDPELIGLSFRNVDDCFWPSGRSFLPDLKRTVLKLRTLTDAPIVLGGVGFSIFAARIVEYTGADFGIHGDGEQAVIDLLAELRGNRRFGRVGGLIRRQDGEMRINPPAWPRELNLVTDRDAIDNAAYFRRGGQGGVETKRGCHRRCIYCADPAARGGTVRPRPPAHVADEVERLLAQGVDVLHLCDGEFNLPIDHARAVCAELIRRGLGEQVRWYTYMAVLPFDAELARDMAEAGCVGINFTGDSASELMLRTYRQPHRREHLAEAVRLCRKNSMAVMIDLLLGGPGETPETVADTIAYMKQISPDCVGAALGIRVYPGTGMPEHLAREGPLEDNPSIKRRYTGPVDLLQPTFYISAALGERPAGLVRDLIDGDPRFFEPMDDAGIDGESPNPSMGVSTDEAPAGRMPASQESPSIGPSTDHNYNDNTSLVNAISAGARGAYWDILRGLRGL